MRRTAVLVVVVLSLLCGLDLCTATYINCTTPTAWSNNPTVLSGTSSWFDAIAQGGSSKTTGACRWVKSTSDINVAAYSAPTTPEMCVNCGNCFNVTGPVGSVVVRIIDYCDTTQGQCTTGFFTLDKVPYVVIAGSTGTGSVSIKYFPVQCPVQGTLQYLFQSGVDQWYVSINVANERYPLQSVEIMHGGQWQPLPRASYNYWYYNPTGTPQTFPTQIRVTDTLGQQIVDTLNSEDASGTTVFYSNSQFGGITSGNPSSTGSGSTVVPTCFAILFVTLLSFLLFV